MDLTPTVIQDAVTGDILTLAWSSEESLRKVCETHETWLWSRSRNELWHKGDTSGHTQRVIDTAYDCDGDAVILQVIASGPACHRDTPACWDRANGGVLSRLDALVGTRRPVDEGHTARLLGSENLRVKKLGEETAEFIHALARGTDAQVINEAADVLYHVLVAVRARGIPFVQVLRELWLRERR